MWEVLSTSGPKLRLYDPSGQESHPYGYAGCNPASAKDPTGRDTYSVMFLLQGLLVGAAVAVAVPTLFAGIAAGSVASVALFAAEEALCP